MLMAMTPQTFVAKWKASTRNERAAAQEHFLDLCDLLNEPKPGSAPKGSTYAFGRGAAKATQGEGWAADISEDAAMERLPALNLGRASMSASNQRAGA